MANQEIRSAAKANAIPLWMVAEKLSISEPTMTRRLRRELSEEDKAHMLAIIQNLAKEGLGWKN